MVRCRDLAFDAFLSYHVRVMGSVETNGMGLPSPALFNRLYNVTTSLRQDSSPF
ncbi:hypothetical protein [Caldivirga sp.]|uniref:hypothetical protein n=1 Tax=Caldivirga sp. TaxID=2080243 RepID=UPI003D0E84EC